MQFLAWKLKLPLITVSCHDDLSTSDLVGRYLIRSGEAVWTDDPSTLAVRNGAICYLDEIVEARKADIHPFCITIDQEAKEYMKHMYGPANYIFIDDVRKLPVRMPAIYRALTS